jgi:hypothetical protein
LIYAGLRDIGLDVENIRAYAKTPDGVLLRETVVHHFGTPVSAWRPGDIALMRWHENREKVWHSHVGILGAHNDQWTLLHAYLQQGRVVEHRIDERWNGRITEVFSLTGAG